MSSGLCLFLFEFSAIALIVMDGNNRIILVNSKAGKLFGCGRAELFAETIDTLTLEGIRFTNAGSPKVVRFVASGKTDRKCRSRSVGVRFRLKAAGARWSPSSISRSTKRQRSGSLQVIEAAPSGGVVVGEDRGIVFVNTRTEQIPLEDVCTTILELSSF